MNFFCFCRSRKNDFSFRSSHDLVESTDDTSTNDSSIPEDTHKTNELFESMADGGLASFVKSSSNGKKIKKKKTIFLCFIFRSWR